MNFQFKDELNGTFSVLNAEEWLKLNSNKAIETYSIIINLGKRFALDVDLNEISLDHASSCFLNPGCYVSSISNLDNDHYFIDFNAAFYCLELHDKDLSCNGLLFGAMPSLPLLSCNEKELTEKNDVIERMIKEFDHDDDTKGEMLRLLLKQLIIISVRIGRKQLFSEENPNEEDTDVIRNFQALVEKHFKEKHKVSDYAELMFKSPKTLSNTFKKLGSVSPLQIIQERIVLEAKRQMNYTDKSIKEIAYEIGYTEPAQFSRLFKNITGESPSDFQDRI